MTDQAFPLTIHGSLIESNVVELEESGHQNEEINWDETLMLTEEEMRDLIQQFDEQCVGFVQRYIQHIHHDTLIAELQRRVGNDISRYYVSDVKEWIETETGVKLP